MEKDVSLESAEEEECFVGWGFKVGIMDLQLSCSFTEEVTVSVKAIFEVVFKFAASEARNKFDIRASEERGEIGDQMGSDQGVIGELSIKKSLVIYEK